ncbi:hypothetical protein HPB51_015623 [Rhipicephalus microplus]|uniref:Uncharacterized protein n=1 Tax=Rhipicephalus microplus TaxID=6941 RepID=A0A9J6EHV4_RHIMP|nr:hypothetical protein HPB51_015623 [Rhipicephalus microplus]
MAAPNTSGGGMPSAALASAAQAQLLAKRPRRGFTAEDDLAVLREVSAVKLFGDNLLWIRMIGSLKPVLGRETTLRSLKDRVDLLIGYWRQEDSRKLRRSGTEEQYAKKEQILQDLSEYTRSINYVLRIAPRSSNSSGRKRSHAAASCLATLPEQVRADGEQGIRGLQSMGLQLLTMHQTHEFEIRQRKLAVENRKLDIEERRLALEERKLALAEKKA